MDHGTSSRLSENVTLIVVARICMLVTPVLLTITATIFTMQQASLADQLRELNKSNARALETIAGINASDIGRDGRIESLSKREDGIEQVQRDHEGRIVRIETIMGVKKQ